MNQKHRGSVLPALRWVLRGPSGLSTVWIELWTCSSSLLDTTGGGMTDPLSPAHPCVTWCRKCGMGMAPFFRTLAWMLVLVISNQCVDSTQVPVFAKKLFSMCTEDVMNHVNSLPNKPTDVVLFGIEAHVCVTQVSPRRTEEGLRLRRKDLVPSPVRLLHPRGDWRQGKGFESSYHEPAV